MQGGVGDCTNEIAKALDRIGVETRVLTSAHARGGTWQIPVEPLVEKWDWASYRIMREVIRRYQPDIIHTQYQTAAFGMHPAINFLPFFFKRAGSKFGITFHDLRPPYLFPKAGRVRDWVTVFPARHSDFTIVTNAEDDASLAARNVGHRTVIPIGSNITPTLPKDYSRATWRLKYGAGENDLLLCYFGFLNDSKGGLDLMRALALVPNAKLLMVGGQVGASDETNAAYLGQVKHLIVELNLAARVIWTGYTDPGQVSANLLAADICVLPYRDGASFRRGSLMAALAHGLAIVTTTPASIGKGTGKGVEIRDGENALLAPPQDPRRLAEAVMRLAKDAPLREKIRAGAKQLADNFTWDKIAAQHFDLYQRLGHS